MRQTGFDERLRSALLESGWTQDRLALRLDVTQATVSRWLSGKFMPSRNTIPCLAETLGVEVQWLVNGDGDRKRIYANNPAVVNQEILRSTWRHQALVEYLPPEESPDVRACLEQARQYLDMFLGELSERQIISKISEVLSDQKMPVVHRIVISQEMLNELARRNGFRGITDSPDLKS